MAPFGGNRSKQKTYDNEGLFQYAARLLGGRALTIAELQRKLAARAAVPADVEDVLSRLKQAHVLNDRRFADSYAAVRRDGSGFGRARVLRELDQRQVPRLVAQAAVEQAYGEVDEVEHAVAFLRRKVRVPDPVAYFADPKHVQAAFRRLRYNGFSAAAAGRALRQWTALADEIHESDGEESE